MKKFSIKNKQALIDKITQRILKKFSKLKPLPKEPKETEEEKKERLIKEKEKGIKYIDPKILKKVEFPDDLFEKAEKGDVSILKDPRLHDSEQYIHFVDGEGLTPFHLLARKGKTQVLGHPAVAEVFDNEGRTPMHDLAQLRNDSVLRNENVSKVKDKNGKTPLHILLSQGVNSAISHDDAGKVKDKKGWTPLHYGGILGNVAILNNDKVAKVKDPKGNTPLHNLGLAGKKEILGHDAVATVTNNAGETPLMFLADKEPVTVAEVKGNIFKEIPDYLHENDELDKPTIVDLMRANSIGK